jgi:hypothetical protein
MKQHPSFWKTRGQQLLASVISFFLAWLLFLRATDTGSLWQWGLVILLICLAINRLFRAVIPKSGSKK